VPIGEPTVSVRRLSVHYRVASSEGEGPLSRRQRVARRLGLARTVTVRAIDDVSFVARAGESIGVVGHNGSGKSTLLRVLAMLDRADTGSVRIGALDVTAVAARERRRLRRRHIAYVAQQPADNLIDYLDAAAHIELGTRLRGGDGVGDADLLDLVGLGDRRDHRPAQLSGGEQQRLGFAFAVAGGPRLLVADEPTAVLDHVAGRLVIDALGALAERGLTVVASSHDAAVIDRADQVLRLDHGRVVS
jgi:ABC-type glutathione transport system ATPase component